MAPRIPSQPLARGCVDAAACSLPRTAAPFVRNFSTTSSRAEITRGRHMMYTWLNNGAGSSFKESSGRPNYLGPYKDQPFPNNPLFRSQSVLDETTKELIWEKVTKRGEPLKVVSAEMGVDVRRVAAVVRLKEVEKKWIATGKTLATPYAKAVMSMLPKTSYREGQQNEPHEPINEVHVHNLTMQQLFVPVSESRHFTREDAAKAFHENMLSADERSPQPKLIAMAKEIIGGAKPQESWDKFKLSAQEEEDAIARKLQAQQQREAKKLKAVKTDRYEFRFKSINVEDVGRNGRSRKGTGWRYGAPFNDRKRGQIKIPTSVP